MAGQAPVNTNASNETKALLSYLYTLMSPCAGLLTGQHNWLEDPMGNINSLALPNSGGKYPAVIGLEVGPISGQNAETAYNQRAAIADTAKAYYQAGGIPTIMWHCTYPGMPYQWSGGVQRATTQEEFNQILTPGDPKYNWLIAEMDNIAVHFKTLQAAGVPILFRPWHEMNGYWFWWGKKSNLAALWNLTYERFTTHHGLNNILWVWNPNCMKATDPGIGDYKLYYPGHSEVDVLAWDIYGGEFTQSFHDDLFDFGGGKPIALGEVGRLPDMNLMKSSQWRYTWAMAWGEALFSNENNAANKQQFYSNAYAITRDEVDITTPPPTPDNIPPTVPANVSITDITHNSVSLKWDASTDNVGVTGYDILQGNTIAGSTASTSFNINGLAPSTPYTFVVRAKDAAGNLSSTSTAVSATTEEEPEPGTTVFVTGINFNGSDVTVEGNRWLAENSAGVTMTPPILRHIGNASFSPDSQTNVMLNSDIYSGKSFSINQNIANGSYEVYVWTVENYKTNYRSFHVKLEGIQVTSSPIGSMALREWRKYGPFKVTVRDGTLNMELVRVTGDPMITGMAIYSVSTTPPPLDTTAPSVPTNVVAASTTHSSVSLTWSASTDNIGVTGYDVLRSNVVVGSTASTSFTVTGLSPSTTYTFAIRAKDAAGNLSAASQPVSVTTDAETDPGTPVFVKGINFNGGAVTVEGNSWLAENAAGVTMTPPILRHSGNMSFTPAVDTQTSAMLNSDIFSGKSFSINLKIANGSYEVYLWTVENFKSNYRSFHIKLEGTQVTSSPIGSLPLREWRKHGPYNVTVKDGNLNMELIRVTGDPMLTGMAVYSVGN